MKRIMVAVPTREYIDVDSEKSIRKLEKDSWLNRDIEVDIVLQPLPHNGKCLLRSNIGNFGDGIHPTVHNHRR